MVLLLGSLGDGSAANLSRKARQDGGAERPHQAHSGDLWQRHGDAPGDEESKEKQARNDSDKSV